LSELLKGEFATEIFGKISRGFYWATNSSGTEIFDPWEGSGRAALLGRYNTLCVRDLLNSLDLNNEEKIVKSKFNSSFGDNERYRWTTEIVEDKKEELIWQRQETGKKNFVDAQLHCEGLKLAGASDWRLPLMSELRELNRQITSDSEVHKEIFNQPIDSFFWSGALTDMGTRVWTINLWTGRAERIDPKRGDQYATMCVRSSEVTEIKIASDSSKDLNNEEKTVKSKFNSSFGDNERYRWTTEIVEDKEKKLIWQRQNREPRNHAQAVKFCDDLNLAGSQDWRLPSMWELEELFEVSNSSFSEPELLFPNSNSLHWSSTRFGQFIRLQNPIDDSWGTVSVNSNDLSSTLCVKDADASSSKNSPTLVMDRAFYLNTANANKETIGCGFFHVGCEEKALTFPAYQPDFHLKGYRRVNLWGKDRPWTDTELQLQNGDQVYFYGTGEVTTCPHSSCSGRGPQNLNKGSLSYKISEGASPGNLNRFTRIRYGSSGFKSSIQARSNGALYLSVRDWNTYPPPSNYYDDNSGVYILDIFVIDPDQEDGFNRFKDALFKVNPNDSNAKAYLGR